MFSTYMPCFLELPVHLNIHRIYFFHDSQKSEKMIHFHPSQLFFSATDSARNNYEWISLKIWVVFLCYFRFGSLSSLLRPRFRDYLYFLDWFWYNNVFESTLRLIQLMGFSSSCTTPCLTIYLKIKTIFLSYLLNISANRQSVSSEGWRRRFPLRLHLRRAMCLPCSTLSTRVDLPWLPPVYRCSKVGHYTFIQSLINAMEMKCNSYQCNENICIHCSSKQSYN